MTSPRAAWGMTPDNYPSVEKEPLSPIEQEMERYQRRFLPETTKALERQGPHALATEIRARWWRAEYGRLLAVSRGMPEQAAEELTRTELYPPPEPQANPDRALSTTT